MDYLISDLHLDHDNIIDYCDRPFSSVEEMNDVLVEHWNTVVDPDDEVLYGGDLTIRTSAAALLDWLNELNGEIVFLPLLCRNAESPYNYTKSPVIGRYVLH